MQSFVNGKHPNAKVDIILKKISFLVRILLKNLKKLMIVSIFVQDLVFVPTFTLGCVPHLQNFESQSRNAFFLITQNITNRFLLAIPQKKRLCKLV